MKAYEFSKRTQLPHSEHRPSGIGHTGNTLGIGHTGNRSDQEHGSVRTRHHSDVSRSSRRNSNTRRNTISLQHTDPGEHSPASMIRHRSARSRSHSYDSVSLRRHGRLTSRARGKKKEHSKSHSFKRDKSMKKHKRKWSLFPPPSPLSSSVFSDSFSSHLRSPARKKSRLASRSSSPAGVNHQSASRTASPTSHWDHLSHYADSNVEFNSHSEDSQDLVPNNTDPVLESQSESLRRTCDLLTLTKKLLNFFRPTCS